MSSYHAITQYSTTGATRPFFCICMAGSQRVNTSYKASLYAHSQLIQVVSIYLTYLNLMRHSNDIKWLQGLLGTIGLDSPANGAKCKSF